MRQPVFTGACVAIITPFTPDNKIDFPRFGQLIERQIAAGTDAICVCGTTGESATMTLEEHMQAVEFCVNTVNGRAKVLAGSGCNDTASALVMSQHAESVGADALLSVTPYYNKATQKGLIKHYEYLADRVNTPIILYNVPSRTGCSFTASTYQHLSKHPNIVGVKEASGNFTLLAETRALCGDEFYLWSGNDDQVVPMMSLGAKGVISVVSNIWPELMVQMTHLCLEGKFEEASKLQIDTFALANGLFMEVNPIPVKTAAELMGLCSGALRLPLCEMTDEHTSALRTLLTQYNIPLKN